MQTLDRLGFNKLFFTPFSKEKVYRSRFDDTQNKFGDAPYSSLTQFTFDKFGTTDTIPKGYIWIRSPSENGSGRVVYSRYVGSKGCNGDWAELIPCFPILIVLFVLVAVLLIAGLIYLFYRIRNDSYTCLHYPKYLLYIFIALVIILVIVICWALFISISAQVYAHKFHGSDDKPRSLPSNSEERQIKHVVEFNYDELRTYSDKNSKAMVDENLENIQRQIKPSIETVSGCFPKLDDAMKVIGNASSNIYTIRVNMMEWIDVMRLFQRNMTFRLLQYKEGEEILDRVKFKTFYYTFLKMDTLASVENTFNDLKYSIDEFKKASQRLNDIQGQLDQNIKEVLKPHLANASFVMEDKGKNFRALFKSVYRREDSERKDNDSRPANWCQIYMPKEVFYLPWIGYILVILICICVVISLIYSFLKGESQNKFYRIAIYMIGLFSAIILVSVLWHFFYSTVLHHNYKFNTADSHKRAVNRRNTVSSICSPEVSLFESLQSHGLTDSVKDTLVTDVDSLAEELQRKMADVLGNSTGPSSNKSVDALDDTNYCDQIVKTLDLEYLKLVYQEMSAYVNNGMENKWGLRDLSSCHLNRIRTTRIDPFENSELAKRAKLITQTCKHIQEIFEHNIGNYLDGCQQSLGSVEHFYFNIDLKDVLGTAILGLIQFLDENLAAYVSMMTDTLENDVGLCKMRRGQDTSDNGTLIQNQYPKALGVWCGIFLILFILPLLMLLMCCLDLYGAPEPSRTYKRAKKSTYREARESVTMADKRPLLYEDIRRRKAPKMSTPTHEGSRLNEGDIELATMQARALLVKYTNNFNEFQVHDDTHKADECQCPQCKASQNTTSEMQRHERSFDRGAYSRNSEIRNQRIKWRRTPGESFDVGTSGQMFQYSRAPRDNDDSSNKSMCRALCDDIVDNVLPPDRGISCCDSYNTEQSDMEAPCRCATPPANKPRNANGKDEQVRASEDESRRVRIRVKMLWRSKAPRRHK